MRRRKDQRPLAVLNQNPEGRGTHSARRRRVPKDRTIVIGKGARRPGSLSGRSRVQVGNGARLVSHDKHVAGILRVNLPVRTKRCGGVGRSEVQLLEDSLLESATLVDSVQEAVLAVRVDDAVDVDYRGVHTPLEAVRMRVRSTAH